MSSGEAQAAMALKRRMGSWILDQGHSVEEGMLQEMKFSVLKDVEDSTSGAVGGRGR